MVNLMDLKLTGEQEVFTVTVNYDTQELYGKVRASRSIMITSIAPRPGG